MTYKIVNLNLNQIKDIENRLDAYDQEYISYKYSDVINIGIEYEGRIIAGVDASMTAFNILYISTLFVDSNYRKQGLGKILIEEVELRAKKIGANMIRVDTFNWQGRDFYLALDYEEVGSYENKIDNYSEHFFIKRI